MLAVSLPWGIPSPVFLITLEKMVEKKIRDPNTLSGSNSPVEDPQDGPIKHLRISNCNSVFAGYPWTQKCNVWARTQNKYLLYEWVHGQKDLQRRRKDAGVWGEIISCWLPGSQVGSWFLIYPRPRVLPWVPGDLVSSIKRRFYFCLRGFLLCATQGSLVQGEHVVKAPVLHGGLGQICG